MFELTYISGLVNILYAIAFYAVAETVLYLIKINRDPKAGTPREAFFKVFTCLFVTISLAVINLSQLESEKLKKSQIELSAQEQKRSNELQKIKDDFDKLHAQQGLANFRAEITRLENEGKCINYDGDRMCGESIVAHRKK